MAYVRLSGIPPTDQALEAAREYLGLNRPLVMQYLDWLWRALHLDCGLSFLGLGVQPPTPEWGVMINDARQFIWIRPELIMYPGAMIFLAVIAFNIPGDTLRDSLDPMIRSEEV